MSKTTIAIIIIAIIILKILYNFIKDIKADQSELKYLNLKDKINILIDELNRFSFNNEGKINIIDNRSLYIYKDKSNQIIKFFYGTGTLEIEWRIKYLQQEMIYKNKVHDARNLSQDEQIEIAKNLIIDFKTKYDLHVKKVNSNTY